MNKICYDCGKTFNSTDIEATICPNCIKLYNKPIKPITVTSPKEYYNPIGLILLLGGGGTLLLIILFTILKGLIGITG